MLSQVKYSQLPSRQAGREPGEVKGRSNGPVALLQRQLACRFAGLNAGRQCRLNLATPVQIAHRADNILNAARLGEGFKLN